MAENGAYINPVKRSIPHYKLSGKTKTEVRIKMANKNFSFSSMPSLFLFLLLVANLLMLLAPPVDSALLPKKPEKCLVYNPAKSEAGHRVKRLTDGIDGDIRKMPWMVMVKANYSSLDGHRTFEGFCTATLVSRRHVLTVSHCAPLSRMPNSSYMITVQYGSANRSAFTRAISVPKANFHVNPQSSSFLVNNSAFLSGQMTVNMHDAALIDLGQDLDLDETVHPICVACLNNQTFPQGQAYIAGYGSIIPLCVGRDPALQDLFSYQSVGLHQCLTPGYVVANKVCTQADLTHGIRGGDSGGPVMASANGGKTFLQVGLLGNTNCQSDQREDGSTKIDKQWFEQMTGVKCKKFRVNNNNDDDCEDEE